MHREAVLTIEDLQYRAWGGDLAARISTEDRMRAQYTVGTLRRWGAKHEAQAAAILAPILERGRRHISADGFTPVTVELAQRLSQWRAALNPGTETESARDTSWHLGVLSRLFRQAYLDLPSLSFTLLLLADHDALVSSKQALSVGEAKLTHKVYAPLTEMLGLWGLFKRWEEKCYEVLSRDEYREMKGLLGDKRDYSKNAFRAMCVERADGQEDGRGPTADADPAGPRRNTYLVNKAEAFLSLRREVITRLARKGVRVCVTPIRNYPSFGLRRVAQGESKLDVARRLCVRIICRTVDDCYAALGTFHSLGRPVSLGSPNLRFKDQIASPQTNGYRALHSAITYRNYKCERGGEIIAECRILTREMFELNEYGVVAGMVRREKIDSPNAWWNYLPELSRQLQRVGSEGPFEDYLRRHDIGSYSDPLYVFTPLGEVVLLGGGATPLDFAYRIHTEMGHHALRFEVNGQVVTHGYPLRNGDIVRVHYDPAYAGPDMSWLGMVATQHARQAIRRRLAVHARSAHKGRAKFEEALLSMLGQLKREKKYDLCVTSERVASFLKEAAQADGCVNVTEFYGRLAADPNLPYLVARRLVSTELSTSVVGPEEFQQPSRRIKVCTGCLPVPGEPIVGVAVVADSARAMVVHRAERKSCLRYVDKSNQAPLSWADSSETDQNELLMFWVKGDDRDGLLRELLEVIHGATRTHLYKVEACVYGNGRAEISMLVKADSLDRFSEILARLSSIAGVHEILSVPPSPTERATLPPLPVHPLLPRQQSTSLNPYTAEEVYQRGIFYNREKLLESLTNWLMALPPADVMILHGQRRVGKSSLVRYFMQEHLPTYRLVRPVLVDMQGLSEFAPRNIANYIVHKVYTAIGLQPPPGDGLEPMDWLNSALDEAQRHCPRLLIIIDEFNVLIDIERAGGANKVVYSNLRSVMNAQRHINWLLVVQDTHFFDRDMWRGAGVLFQRASKLAVRHLDSNWARRLILEPARSCGLLAQDADALIEEVLRLTSGNPYLIHLICFHLVERSRRQYRTSITKDDVKVAAQAVLHYGDRYFFHFTENLSGVREVVMAAVTAVMNDEDLAGEEDVVGIIQRRAKGIDEKTVRRTLTALAQEGLVERDDDPAAGRRVRIPIKLFRTYIMGKLDLDAAARKWRASRGQTRKVTKR